MWRPHRSPTCIKNEVYVWKGVFMNVDVMNEGLRRKAKGSDELSILVSGLEEWQWSHGSISWWNGPCMCVCVPSQGHFAACPWELLWFVMEKDEIITEHISTGASLWDVLFLSSTGCCRLGSSSFSLEKSVLNWSTLMEVCHLGHSFLNSLASLIM